MMKTVKAVWRIIFVTASAVLLSGCTHEKYVHTLIFATILSAAWLVVRVGLVIYRIKHPKTIRVILEYAPTSKKRKQPIKPTK